MILSNMYGRDRMQLCELTIENLDIPFKMAFQHSAAARITTETVLVRAESAGGVQGIGEGCPRHYVTGETLLSARDFFTTHRSDFMVIGRLNELKTWMENHTAEIDKNPAAFCAIELALLDVLAKESGQSVETLLLLPKLSGAFHYTGVLGASDPKSFRTMFKRYLHLGITDFKVKIFGKAEIDHANINVIRECGQDNLRVRIDANNLWSDPDEVIRYIADLDYPIFALEEPLGAHEYDSCRKVFRALGTPIILDESFVNTSDFEPIQDNAANWIINIRISKMGGILRSCAIADKAKKTGIPIIIGSQVGETSILTRAALTVANAHREILLAQEGAYGTHLLEYDLIDPPLMFGKGGILTIEQI